ncbi:hypothetical protein [Streptomyces palmae]|uniref:DUF1273 family protein n=1 Tax=Streptomyces palmae TaxID=1701085 RepID=A0A4Z0HAH4_9ACTN|nr:hypothetical protein [Streptomyces palmae]TGB10211.1 hypothetical protein E4099_12935 [Streptomyces palmae]
MRLGITGHRGLPAATEELIRPALREEILRRLPAELVAVSCVADGPDAWFAQAVLDAGGQLEVVIPADRYREGLPVVHHAEYDALLRRASRVHTTGMTESDSQAHMRGSEILVDLADELIAVWDGLPARGYGGTADVVAYAGRQGVTVHRIWPSGSSRD